MHPLPSVFILHNRPGSGSAFTESDSGVMDEVDAVASALKKLGVSYSIGAVERIGDIRSVLAKASEPVVFNLVESLKGAQEDYNYVPAICRANGRSATGTDTAGLLLTFDKWKTKALLKAGGVNVPEAYVVEPDHAVIASRLPPMPCIIKPVASGASEGIKASNVFSSFSEHMEKAVAELHANFHQQVLIEQFIDGREFNVSVIEMDGKAQVLPIAEIDFTGFPANKAKVVDYAAKWKKDSAEYKHTARVIPADVGEELAKKIRHTALAAFHICGCKDYARVDMRIDADEKVYVLEVNANPDISPDAGFAAALKAGGIHYDQFIAAVIKNAYKRIGAPKKIHTQEHTTETGIRASVKSDREAVLTFSEASGYFRPDELDIAKEVFDDSMIDDADGSYLSFTYVENGKPVGWLCFGPAPCAIGAFDIYWVVVSASSRRKGIGKAMLQYAEKLISGMDGRLIVIETSGQSLYESTMNFYRKLGYEEDSRTKDFYAPGDDKVVFVKRLAQRKTDK